jgi:diadenylate cyclase
MEWVQSFLRSYTWYEVLFEMAVIGACVHLVFRFLRGTRGAGVIKGVALLLVVLTLIIQLIGAGTDRLERLKFIYEWFLGLLAVVLVVVFQPELRQAMIRLGHARFFRHARTTRSAVVEAVNQAVEFLSKSQFGALIALERDVQLGGLIEGGEALDAKLSARLLESIFWPNSPLHDLGVVIRGDRVIAANVQFPLVEEGHLQRQAGSRHRAAAGLSLESDCLVVIVSEETGGISIAERGVIEWNIPRDSFREVLAERLAAPPPEPPEKDREKEREKAKDKEPERDVDEHVEQGLDALAEKPT